MLFHCSLPRISRFQALFHLPLPLFHRSVRYPSRLLRLLESGLRPLSCCKRFRTDIKSEAGRVDRYSECGIELFMFSVRESVRLPVPASYMSKAEAGNLVVMSLSSAAPLPRLSVSVGAIRTLSLCSPGGSTYRNLRGKRLKSRTHQGRFP